MYNENNKITHLKYEALEIHQEITSLKQFKTVVIPYGDLL